MRRWIATITNDDWGLVEEQEFTGTTDIIEAFYQFGWIKPYDDTLPLPPKGIGDYETGKAYPNNRRVFKDNAIWASFVGDGNYTSTQWVEGEWILKIQGS